LTVATSQYARDHIEQAIVKLLLIYCEVDGESLGLADGKLSNVSTPSPVDQWAKGVKIFDAPCYPYPIRIAKKLSQYS